MAQEEEHLFISSKFLGKRPVQKKKDKEIKRNKNCKRDLKCLEDVIKWECVHSGNIKEGQEEGITVV